MRNRIIKPRPRSAATRRVELYVTLAFILAAACVWSAYPNDARLEAPEASPNVVYVPVEGDLDFSKFEHSSAQHARMPCLLCHKREVGLTRPKMPGHMPCAGCHVTQFADNQNPICTICHTATSVKPFPPLRSFNIMFNHGLHIRQTGCATCHKPNRGGAGLSVPGGSYAHTTCFQCHGPQTEVGGRNIGSCATCHQLGRPQRATDSSRAYSVNFSHREHLRGSMNCSSCHLVQAGSARGRQVTAPLVSMHFAPAGRTSCAACHNNKRAFGPPDFKDCRRCHEGRTFAF
ncbi:MAG: cytochrome c3 family protein [Acidobacteria bacterium]|nr:cytochrome c3 family protein [Acidobacteriota bacterium]